MAPEQNHSPYDIAAKQIIGKLIEEMPGEVQTGVAEALRDCVLKPDALIIVITNLAYTMINPRMTAYALSITPDVLITPEHKWRILEDSLSKYLDGNRRDRSEGKRYNGYLETLRSFH